MTAEVEELIEQARAGDPARLGQLLASYQNYLRLMARIQIGRRLQGKVDASDVVQETFLEAHRHFPTFQGHAAGQLTQWLRAILATTLANTIRRYLGTQARDLRLEQQLAEDLDQSTCALGRMLVDPHSSPSQLVMKGEQSLLVAEAMARLPDDYQTVLVLRHMEGLTFPQVAERMGRSVDSVEKLWLRIDEIEARIRRGGFMSATPDDIAEDDPRILQVSREYLAELEAGHTPDRHKYLDRYPELAEILSECLEGIDLAQSLRRDETPGNAVSGSPLGDFNIVRELGRGGMGVVYEAIQLSLGRRVALKVLPFAAALDARQLQRFKNEAHAAAQLHHTNIVPVYAVGCERGVHFYAMQLIEGRSLASVIQDLRETDDENPPQATTAANMGSATIANSAGRTSHRSRRNTASFRTAARLIAQVADALEYAHDAGVIHRDVKPANLLMDTRGGVWITDFGLAQVVADAGLTQTGDLVGTLRYMSPEQAAGRRTPVDHRADIYSLGATLYEFLTLRPIFSGDDRGALLHQILNDDPRPLRQLDGAVPVELETIVLKATAKSPVDRYATAADMAADLRRYLDERPILARRPTVLEKVRKWMRRHPSFVGAAVILMVCGMIGLSIFSALVAQEQALTKAAYEREIQRAAEAEARFKMARRAADEMIRLAEEELSDNPFVEGLRMQLLETALGYYQEFIAQREERPDAQVELAVTRDRVKQILADLALLKADRQNEMLRDPAVLADLQVSEDQRIRIGLMVEQMEQKHRRMPRGPRDTNPEDDRQKLLAMARENEATLASILTSIQLHRLPQINLQRQGPRALHDSSVVSTLKLTTEQQKRIKKIERENEPYPPNMRGRGPEADEVRDERARNALEKMLTVLTPAQMAQWKTMIGEPYTGPIQLRHGPDFPHGRDPRQQITPGFPGPPGGPGGPRDLREPRRPPLL